MKKILLIAALALGATGTMSAQYKTLGGDLTLGLEGGATTHLKGGPFWGDMRGAFGINLTKQINPYFGLGVEALWGVNTSSWKGMVHSNTAIDSQYVGVFGTTNLFNCFGGVRERFFDIEAVAGAGWGHYYQTGDVQDWNFFATKAGLNFNFHVTERLNIALKPSVIWNMSDADVAQSSAAYNANRATFNLMAGVSYIIDRGTDFTCQYTQSDIDELNGRINGLRGDLDAAAAALAASEAQNAALAQQLNDCLNRKPEVVKQTTDQLSTVRYVNFEIGKTNITASQMPNVAAVASYLKNHPKSNVVIKGYASQDGPEDVNIRLANGRAASVKDTLIKKYGIKADRIQAEGQGIGHMFEVESWNRVAICTLDQPATTTSTVTK